MQGAEDELSKIAADPQFAHGPVTASQSLPRGDNNSQTLEEAVGSRAALDSQSSRLRSEKDTGPPCISSRANLVVLFLWSQWFMIAFGLVILLSYLVPNLGKRTGYLAAEYSISYGALAVIFLIAGLTMPTRALVTNLRNWKVHLITQSMCFIITPLVGLVVVECILASKTDKINPLVLTGIIIMVCTPTTVASNITFTRASGGDDATALVEVTIGNLFGIFISPALVQLFLRPSLRLGVGAPTKPVGAIYKTLIEHFGLAMYLPLFVGQVLRNFWPKEIDRISQAVKLPKWASVCLLLLIWETFSDAFASHAFDALSASSVILIVFLNLGLYPLFTLICFLLCRLPIKGYNIPKGQATAVCFCGPPKSITTGIVLIYSQYGNFSALDQAIISIPLSLYQGMQVFIAQAFVIAFKKWNAAADDPV